MQNKIISYRSKHPRCRYCKYLTLSKVPVACPTYISILYKCSLKDKFLYNDLSGILRKIKGMRCKWFEVNSDG